MKHTTRTLSGLILALTPACADTVTLGTLRADGGAMDAPARDAAEVTAPPEDRPPPVDRVEVGADVVDVSSDVRDAPPACPTPCDDGVFCNGQERCVDGVCAPGAAPCDDGRACTADRCVERWENCEHVPTGDACALPTDVCTGAILLDGPGIYEGTTAGGSDRYVLRCQTMYVPDVRNDVAYQFTLREASDVWVTPLTSPPGNVGDTAVSLVSGCAPLRELTCGRQQLTFVRRGLPPGTYGLVVETRTPGTYRFSFDVRRPEPVPVGDVCPRGADDVVELNDQRRHSAGPGLHMWNWRPSCTFSELDRPDVVMRLTLDAPRSVVIDTTPTTYVELFSGACEGGASVACQLTADIVRRRLEPGTYWVRAQEPNSDPLSVRATLGEPVPAQAGDRCPRAASDAVVDLEPGTRHVVMRWFDHDYNLSCMFPHNPADLNPDRVYRLRVPSRRRVVIEALNAPPGSYAPPDLELLRDECETGAALQCSGTLSSGGTSVRRIDQTLDAGTYWLRVSAGSRIEFDLSMTTE